MQVSAQQTTPAIHPRAMHPQTAHTGLTLLRQGPGLILR
jgi:hypothetical protein